MGKKSKVDPKLEKELIALCWKIIEWKVAYYKPDLIHPTHGKRYYISDDNYDAIEQRYLFLCRETGTLNTLVHKSYPGFEEMVEAPHYPMMEVDDSRPAVKLVMAKLKSPRQ